MIKPRPVAPAVPLPQIVRPKNLGRSDHKIHIRAPEHAHLPRWVQRTHEQADAILGDILAQLSGASRQETEKQVRELVDTISTGKFSAAWNYPKLIEQAMTKLEAERSQAQAAARAQAEKQAAQERAQRDAEARRRSKEVARTRAQIERYKTGSNSSASQETWQDVLKRLTTGDAGS